MKLQLIRFDEDSGTCELELDDEAKQMLLEKGFNSLLWETLKKLEAEHEREKNGSL